MVRVPLRVVKSLGLKAGDLVEITVHPRPGFFGVDPGMGPFTHEDHADHE